MTGPAWPILIDLAKAAQARDLARLAQAERVAKKIGDCIALLDANLRAEAGTPGHPGLGAAEDRWRRATELKRIDLAEKLATAQTEVDQHRAHAARATARLEALRELARQDTLRARRLAERRAEAAEIRQA
ncbi:MAG: hypothetical protein AAGE80_07645 [Pseudomonadota bacterium]